VVGGSFTNKFRQATSFCLKTAGQTRLHMSLSLPPRTTEKAADGTPQSILEVQEPPPLGAGAAVTSPQDAIAHKANSLTPTAILPAG
jgi:hypothetical protein